VAGTGSLEAELRARAASNPRIRFLGPVPQQRLGAYFVHALACVVPSITYESFGMVVIEAFARKTPVIVRDLGALPELVQASGGGIVFRDDAGLLAALGRLKASPGVRRELGERGYETFIRDWSREAHLARYFDLLRQAALERFGGPSSEEDAAPGLQPVPTG
jgi:glycosyltransferase involved in cell wall biosynthesis